MHHFWLCTVSGGDRICVKWDIGALTGTVGCYSLHCQTWTHSGDPEGSPTLALLAEGLSGITWSLLGSALCGWLKWWRPKAVGSCEQEASTAAVSQNAAPFTALCPASPPFFLLQFSFFFWIYFSIFLHIPCVPSTLCTYNPSVSTKISPFVCD